MHRTAPEGHRVLVSAPFGRDADSMRVLLAGNGYDVAVCPTIAHVAERIDEHVGVVLLTEEALAGDLAQLDLALAAQPAWSDIPFILLTGRQAMRRQGADAIRRRLPQHAISVVLLERPLSSESLISTIATAMRGRQRQFVLRDHIAQLAAQQARLNDAVRERTAELEDALRRLREQVDERERVEEALRQAQKMEALGQLTGGIAHDFNNMLTGVIGALDIVKRRIGSNRLDDLDRFMDAAATSAQRAAGLTARLLAFSRRQSLDSRPTDVNALVLSLEDLLHRTMSERISVAIRHADDLPLAIVDANQLEAAILNLAINARDAMPDGGTLTIETGAVVLDSRAGRQAGISAGRFVVVTVSDTGVGMDAETLEKAFEPFYTTKPIGQGTGLGLSMVYGFAKQSNGQVRIHSTVGAGTSVSIYLPVSDQATATDEADTHSNAAEGSGQSVLLVEDDTSVRLLIGEVLRELGYATVEAAEPEEALRVLQSGQRFDLMISDVGLPGMNGRQLAEIARGHLPDLPVLFVTGYAETATVRSGFLGANMAMIAKPFQVDALSNKISEMIHTPRS